LTDETPQQETPAGKAAKVAKEVAKGPTLPKIILIACGVLALLLGGLLLTARYGVLLPQGRLLIEARTDGLKLGRFGRLKVEGLSGDVFRDFTVRRLTVSDPKGVWLEARNVHVSWRYLELLRRRLHADRITAEKVTLIRRPELEPSKPSSGLPISFDLELIKARVEMLPAFSSRRGVYDLAMSLDVQRRNGGQKGTIAADSVLHPGDHLDLAFDFGKTRPLSLIADAKEAQGGALAGALGLPADQPFLLKARASGKNSQGQFTAVATTGSVTPLNARGSWNPQGGSARGRLLLSASELTAGLARRIGPEVTFAITGRKAQPSLYDLDLRLAAANLTLAARGLGNLGERRTGPQGLSVVLTSSELSKVTGGPAMGPARVAGRLNGTLGDLTFDGQAQVDRLKLGEYGLDRVSGPLKLTRKDGALTVEADLAGAGGRGRGFFAAVLGGKPTVSLEGSRLADGRLLLRDLHATGAGLKVSASGSRSLLGGLNFKGGAQVANLAAWRPGASGGVTAEWRATQGGAGKPWTISVDAKGQKFASGMAELDRLLGAAPAFDAAATIDAGKVSVSHARLDGAAFDASSAGVWDRDGALKFKLDWTATGPFRAGPVEVSGKATGSGAITGTLSAPRADLLANIEAIDLPRLPLTDAKLVLSFLRRPDGTNGVFALKSDSAYGPASARTAFAFAEGGVNLSGLDVDAGGVKATGSLTLRRATPSSADLQLAVGKGAFLEAGRVTGRAKIVDAAGGARADLDLTARNAILPGATVAIRNGHITASGPLERLPYQARLVGSSSEGRWNLQGQGVFATRDPGYALTFEGMGRFGHRDLRTTEAAVIRFGGAERSARLRLAGSDGGRIELDARLAGEEADIRARADGLGLGLLNEDLTGSADATLLLSGRGGRLEGTLDAKLSDARSRGSDPSQGLDGTFKARLAGHEMFVDASLTNAQGLRAEANLVLPAEASASPFRVAIARTRPMRGKFLADGEVKPLWDLLVGGERELSGHVHAQGTIGGTLNDPTATGQASVDGGRFADGATGLVLQDVVLRASFANNAVNITQATASDGHGGSLEGSGRLSLYREGASTVRLNLKGFRLIDNELATASATGQATLDRSADGRVRLAGALTIDRADVSAAVSAPAGVVSMEVIEINKPADVSADLQPVRARGPAVNLDVTLKAPRRIFVRGRGLDVELSLDAHVGGTTARPSLSGTARVVRGEYDFASKRFEFDDRGVVYLATSPEAIRLDLTATREDPALTAVVRIRGTAAKPEITLTSTPVLPNDEVLSQVLFGRSASQLSPLEAAQLASALSALAGGGGFDVIGNLRSFAGLDRLALGGGDESGVTVSGGKYLTEDVYLELTGGGREGPTAQVEWQIGRHLSIISKLAGQGDGKLSIRWRRDY
jgi:translocation and assembly module TamB